MFDAFLHEFIGLEQPQDDVCYLIDYLARDRCRVCGILFDFVRAGPGWLCRQCFNSIERIPQLMHATDGDTTILVSSVVAYNEWPRLWVHNLKYNWEFMSAHNLSFFVEEAWWLLADYVLEPPVVVPVPLHWTRRFARGYNQSTILAKRLCDKVGLHLDESLLVRHKKTKTQFGLRKEQRQENMSAAFSVPTHAKLPRCVLLIDDVFTSGTTLLECAKPLYARGVEQVIALAATRAEKGNPPDPTKRKKRRPLIMRILFPNLRI